MANTPFVLKALKILGPEEILKLSEVLQIKRAPLKQAAGGEFIVWDDAVDGKPEKPQEESLAKVLPFTKKSVLNVPSLPDPALEQAPQNESETLIHSDLILFQRERGKELSAKGHQLDASHGYKKATEMYVVKTTDIDGKDKIRFAQINGVLVDKKQA